MNQRRRKKTRRAIHRRTLRAEPLEKRQMLAGDAGLSLHNTDLPADVNGDGRVSSIDALAVVNHITRASNASAEGLASDSRGRNGAGSSGDSLSGGVGVRGDHTVESSPVSDSPESGSSASDAPVVEAAPAKMVDVDNNGVVTAKDALMVINALNLEGEISPGTPLPPPLDYSMFPKAPDVDDNLPAQADFDVLSNFKTFSDDPDFEYTPAFNKAFQIGADGGFANQLTTDDVETLLERASAATSSDDAIIAVVDRNGTILGVRVEAGVDAALQADKKKLAFAIDGAVAKARTAAFFSNNEAPITSRTIRSLSQSTMAQRVVESSPVESDPRYMGPGFVAPIGPGGKFPPEVDFTPQVDLFAIEHQSRDSQRHPGADGIKGNVDDFYLRTRFNADPTHIPKNAETFFQTWPESYGVQTETFLESQSRGVATLPGGVPLFKLVTNMAGVPVATIPGTPVSEFANLVGGIGVFFPGEDGFATFEQGFVHGVGQTERMRTNAPKVLEAEFAAVIAAAGGGLFNPFQSAFRRDLSRFNSRLPALPNFVLPTGRIDLVGITLEIFGPNPGGIFRQPGIDTLIITGTRLFGGTASGDLVPINAAGDLTQGGMPVPEGWLLAPHDSDVSDLKAEDVDLMISRGVTEALRTRAAIRLDIDAGFRPGARTGMVLSVADTNGELLGVYRMPDATIFSIDVSIAKARNTAYYADPDDLQDPDRIDFNSDGVFGATSSSINDRSGDTLPLGTALTNRTFRFTVEPRYPSGIEVGPSIAVGLANDPTMNLCDQKPGPCLFVAPQSILRLPGINPFNAENLVDKEPLDAAVYGSAANTFSTLAFDAFNQSRNFRDPGDDGVVINGADMPTPEPLANQNGIVFFPGSTPLYKTGTMLVGGFGVSGDGVDQDDVVTVAGQKDFAPPVSIRVDAFTVAGVRLPFQKFNRSPFTP